MSEAKDSAVHGFRSTSSCNLVQAVDRVGEKAGGRRDHVFIPLLCTLCFDENLGAEVYVAFTR